MGKCADFELGPLVKYDRQLLITKYSELKKLNGIILGLATAFNDLKDITWMHEQLLKGHPEKEEVSPYSGQWSGMVLREKRLIAQIIHEVIETLKSAKSLLDHEYVQLAEKKMPDYAAREWQKLIKLVKADQHDTSLLGRTVDFFEAIRNKSASHYSDHQYFYCTYEEWLGRDTLGTEAMYVSVGNKMEQSRFYFADAVCEQLIKSSEKEYNLTEDEAFTHVKTLNFSLRFFIASYLDVLREQKK